MIQRQAETYQKVAKSIYRELGDDFNGMYNDALEFLRDEGKTINMKNIVLLMDATLEQRKIRVGLEQLALRKYPQTKIFKVENTYRDAVIMTLGEVSRKYSNLTAVVDAIGFMRVILNSEHPSGESIKITIELFN